MSDSQARSMAWKKIHNSKPIMMTLLEVRTSFNGRWGRAFSQVQLKKNNLVILAIQILRWQVQSRWTLPLPRTQATWLSANWIIHMDWMDTTSWLKLLEEPSASLQGLAPWTAASQQQALETMKRISQLLPTPSECRDSRTITPTQSYRNEKKWAKNCRNIGSLSWLKSTGSNRR